jgi:hypothetical protein
MQTKKKIEASTKEAGGLSVEELMVQRIELVPDRIEMRHGRRMRHNRHNHGGFNNPTDVNITL